MGEFSPNLATLAVTVLTNGLISTLTGLTTSVAHLRPIYTSNEFLVARHRATKDGINPNRVARCRAASLRNENFVVRVNTLGSDRLKIFDRTGLPDFSRYNIPKNIPNDPKTYQMAIKYTIFT
jgi:hypothetical protein